MSNRTSAPVEDDLPLISQRFIFRLAIVIALLVIATIGISVGGHWLGQRIALGGHSQSQEVMAVTIGEDTLRVPANMIRFADQRRSGVAERLDVYLTWPGLEGYSEAMRKSFDSVEQPNLLIFLQLSQSTMSKEMSGRLGPVYAQLFEGEAQTYISGLTLHHLRADSGYGDEVVLTADRGDGALPYVVRCLIPAPGAKATGADCQRDIHIGNDLTVLYRFSSTLLKDWDHIDAAVKSFVRSRLAEPAGRIGTKTN
ncbi:hypothetical protein N7E02_25570 [Aliirhizobium terrae]|uniref:hypothetical protein n=1 Tax=Terrirhizobium terrae TaxID=2926709 RepID=UPI0025779F90|nr:hypothetical protein [Rhizobium sp. CC-CFT758]WJH39997.1 hypothetical protein N7E02_25570 [Rhizobium sp. CC-CFT758]